MTTINKLVTIFTLSTVVLLLACSGSQKVSETSVIPEEEMVDPNDAAGFDQPEAISAPLVKDLYTADPSAHVFDNRIYIYPSHDWKAGIPSDDMGSHFAMRDYHVYSMESADGPVTDHGVALKLSDIPWAEKQLWAPDAAFANDRYHFYFPAKDKDGIFRIGVASSKDPAGPFKPEKNPIEGSFSIDPAVFRDEDNSYYLYFGGIWGGQLEKWQNRTYDSEGQEPSDREPALGPRIAKLSPDMKQFAETPKEVEILDESGHPILAGDHDRRFFEAAWIHKFHGKYYLSYSTGDTHFIAYAIGDNPYGPFTYQGVILNPVVGWTNHHSIVEFNSKWYLFYHDSTLSGGQTHLRCMKMTELNHLPDGSIRTIDPYRD